MTEIPMPGDYRSPEEPSKPPQKKGCCTRVCECWLYMLCAAMIVMLIIVFLVFYGGLFTLIW